MAPIQNNGVEWSSWWHVGHMLSFLFTIWSLVHHMPLNWSPDFRKQLQTTLKNILSSTVSWTKPYYSLSSSPFPCRIWLAHVENAVELKIPIWSRGIKWIKFTQMCGQLHRYVIMVPMVPKWQRWQRRHPIWQSVTTPPAPVILSLQIFMSPEFELQLLDLQDYKTESWQEDPLAVVVVLWIHPWILRSIRLENCPPLPGLVQTHVAAMMLPERNESENLIWKQCQPDPLMIEDQWLLLNPLIYNCPMIWKYTQLPFFWHSNCVYFVTHKAKCKDMVVQLLNLIYYLLYIVKSVTW